MKHILNIIFVLFLLSGCVKNGLETAQPPSADWESVQRGINVPGNFTIDVKKGIIFIHLEGSKDAIGRFHVKGNMKLDGENTDYDCYYDRNRWYNSKGSELETEEPVNPVMFMENLIMHAQYEFIKQDKGMNIFSFNANAGIIDPLDPYKQGIIHIEKGGYVRNIELTGNDFSVSVKLTPVLATMIRIPGRTEKVIHTDASASDNEVLDRRLKTFGQGYADKSGVHIYEDEAMEFLLQDSLRIFPFEYIEQHLEDSTTSYMYGDMRNTIKAATEHVYAFTGNENITIINKGPYYEMTVTGGPFNMTGNICAMLGKNAIRAECINENEIRILKIPERFIRSLFVLAKYPTEKRIKII